jgi:hypothetical protein
MSKIKKVVHILFNSAVKANWRSTKTDKDLEFKDVTPDTTGYKIVEYGDIPNEPEDKYLLNKDTKDIKTYYFIPSTKFDREYFKRLYPDLKYTRIIKNADMVIYDGASFHNTFMKTVSSRNYGYYSSVVNNVLYIHDEYGIESVLRSSTDPSIKAICGQQNHQSYYFITESISDEFLGKLIHIDKVFDKFESNLLMKNLDKETCLTLLSQVMSDNIGTKKAAVDTILSYKGYDITKKILVSFLSKVTSLGSTKLDFYLKSLGGKRYLYALDYYRNPFFTYIEHVSKDIHNSSDKKDKELATELINSRQLHNYWLSEVKIPFKIEFLKEDNPISLTEGQNISEFLI